MIDRNDIVVLITGTIYEKLIDDLIKTYSNIEHKIISTWYDPTLKIPDKRYAYGGCKPEYINIALKNLESAGFIIVYNNLTELYKMDKNPKPTYISSMAQTIQIYNGLVKAKELGYKYVIRSRTDITCDDNITFNKFIDKTKYLYSEKLCVLCGIGVGKFIYFLDIIIAGDIHEMLLFFGNYPKDSDKGLPAERFWLQEYFKKKYPDKEIYYLYSKNLIRETFNFLLKDLENHNIEFKWFRPKINSTINIVNKYCKKNHSWL